jgi:hypothetical protein
VNYNLEQGWYPTSSPIITANWKANADDRWLVPIGGGVGKLFAIGTQKTNVNVQFFYNPVHPEVTQGPEWTARLVFQLLFPKGR